ncbi:DUF4129 domain-containing protein [Halocatena salina]|uniref:DUF4129 domain-containing protein n=1 Tax=Halocatena salina TaxID=2934340 RepID=A0A8U0A8S1_9EURY|nr:DUF4129 domain-containing protein [Halocatena salina]UPM44423.1 DUF4129 domain-containing protein [Halocatena salina]
MDRSFAAFVFVALFAITVFAVAASSLDSAAIESGFGIDGGPVSSDSEGRLESSELRADGSDGTGSGGFFDTTFAVDPTDGRSGGLSPLVVVGLMIGVSVGGLALVLWVAGAPRVQTESTPASPGNDPEPPDDTSIVAPTNEVYRAWWELVRQLDVTQHRSLSPAELASVAVDEGIDPELVADLTALFRSVRYGDTSITDKIEQRAETARDRLRGEGVRVES